MYEVDESTIRHVLKRQSHWKIQAGLAFDKSVPREFFTSSENITEDKIKHFFGN